jgi:HPt (histidine-containing phosphotransfer) domain-containing protein
MTISSTVASVGEDPIIDASRIRALDFEHDSTSGSNTLLRQLVGMFLESSQREVACMRRLAEKLDFEGLSKKAHCLKSSHLNLGVLRTIPILGKIEAKDYIQIELPRLLEQLHEESELAIDRLKSIVLRV